jgi:hypothetical protein
MQNYNNYFKSSTSKQKYLNHSALFQPLPFLEQLRLFILEENFNENGKQHITNA